VIRLAGGEEIREGLQIVDVDKFFVLVEQGVVVLVVGKRVVADGELRVAETFIQLAYRF
jgi:hypothetical protein